MDNVHLVTWYDGISSLMCGESWHNVNLNTVTWEIDEVTCPDCLAKLKEENNSLLGILDK